MKQANSTTALIVAAGSSSRFSTSIPKQYQNLFGKTILRRTIEKFLNHDLIDHVCVVINPEHEKLYNQSIEGFDLMPPAYGGKTRQESVYNGLMHIKDTYPHKVLVHDAARPFLSTHLISKLIQALDAHTAVIPTLPIVDTIKKQFSGLPVKETVARENLYVAQTPQAFLYNVILKGHSSVKNEICTDDASILEKQDIVVTSVRGEENNFKITTQQDWKRAKMMMAQSKSTHVGMGFDVHKFDKPAKDSFVTLCGIQIPCFAKLIGHSDADVALHALTDALLGAIGKGDIGDHFPPSDGKWKNADSKIFVENTLQLISDMNATIENIDLTIICEKPKISDYKEAMKKCLSDLLSLPLSSVNVKATTTEKLGFTGREEGIAAQACATLSLYKDS